MKFKAFHGLTNGENFPVIPTCLFTVPQPSANQLQFSCSCIWQIRKVFREVMICKLFAMQYINETGGIPPFLCVWQPHSFQIMLTLVT